MDYCHLYHNHHTSSRLGGYYNDDEVDREGRYIMRGFLAGYPGSYDRLKLCGDQHDDNEDGEKRRIS